MARPAKLTTITSKNLTKAEREVRRTAEKKLAGNAENLKAKSYLTGKQKRVFDYIVNELKAAGVVGSLDIYILTQTAITIDRLRTIEEFINQNPDKLYSTSVINSRTKLMGDFLKCCAELSLSPAARAKMGTLAVANKKGEKDALNSLLKGEGVI